METEIGSNESTPPTRKEFNLLFGLFIGIAVVCGLGFITLLISYFEQNSKSFDDLKTQVVTQTAKIDYLTQLLILQQEKK